MSRLLFLAAVCVVGPASALLIAGPQTANRYSGSADFQVYCASCHGAAGKGDGAIATMLKKRPPDLSMLTTNNSGVFPTDVVLKAVDEGRDHTDMPAWTQVFAKASESAGDAAAKERVASLVKYVESLQQKEK